jgi:hypothetical protein
MIGPVTAENFPASPYSPKNSPTIDGGLRRSITPGRWSTSRQAIPAMAPTNRKNVGQDGGRHERDSTTA